MMGTFSESLLFCITKHGVTNPGNVPIHGPGRRKDGVAQQGCFSRLSAQKSSDSIARCASDVVGPLLDSKNLLLKRSSFQSVISIVLGFIILTAIILSPFSCLPAQHIQIRYSRAIL